jgi:hypothetical protein
LGGTGGQSESKDRAVSTPGTANKFPDKVKAFFRNHGYSVEPGSEDEE